MNEFNLLRQRDREMRVVTRPMTATEIAAAVREAGLRSAMNGRALRGYVAQELRKGKLRQDKDEWARN